MIALATKTAELAQRRAVARLPLMVLTTYSDLEAGTVSKTYYWSRQPARYKYGGGATVREFLPLVSDAGAISYGFSHVPDADSPDLRRTQLRIVLAQEDRGAGLIWKDLGSENLQFARLEVADLLVDANRVLRGAGTAWWDFTDYAGTEHVVRFRGEFMAVEEVTDDGVVLVFQATEPNLVLARAEEAGVADPLSLGTPYPLPFGKAKNVPCVNADFGWVTTLAEDITSGTTGAVDVADARKFPLSGSFQVQIGDERITASRVDDVTISLSARAQDGTTAVAHLTGAPVAELRTNVVLVAAGLEAKALSRLYVVKPSTNERVLVPSGSYSVDLADDTTHPGVRVTSVTFTASNYATLYELAGTTAGTRLRFEADVDGATVPFGISYSEGYGFEDGDFWDTFQCSLADIGTDVEITVAADALLTDGATTFGGCETATGWTVTGNATPVSAHSEGTNSLFLQPSSNGQTARLRWAYGTPQDVTGRIIAIDVRGEFPTPDASGPLTDVKVQFTSTASADPGSGKVARFFAASEFTVGEFRTLYFDMDDLDGEGGFDAENLRNLFIEVNLHGTDSDNVIWVDNMRFVTGTAIAQRHVPSPGLDLTSYLFNYRLRLTATDVENIEQIKVVLDSAVLSGVDAPLAPHSFVIPGSELTEATLATIEATGSGGTSFDYNAVRTLRIEITLFTPGAGSVVTLHGIDVAAEDTSTWDDAGGTLIEEGTDVIRYFIEVLCGLTIEAASFATAKTNLGGVAFAGLYDALGRDFGAILAGLEYETRTNVVRVEKASGTEYRALNAAFADSLYTFPAAVATLAEVRGLRETAKDALECPSRFAFHYNPAPGNTDDRSAAGFLSLLRASADLHNDFTGSPDRIPTADLEAAEAALGRRDAEPSSLLASRVEATAIDVAGYYIHEALRRGARRWTHTVPLWEGYALEPGDCAELLPRWRNATAKARVLQVSHRMNEPIVGLVLEEVL